MNLRFNSNGNLHETAELSFDAFQLHFGTNASRKEKIKNAVTFFKIFGLCGCKEVYVAGSFVSKKKNPEDIDLLFDLTEVDDKKLRTVSRILWVKSAQQPGNNSKESEMPHFYF